MNLSRLRVSALALAFVAVLALGTVLAPAALGGETDAPASTPGPLRAALPAALPVAGGAQTPGPGDAPMRLLSSPDFLNADVADLRRGPGFWSPERSENGTNASYGRALDRVLDDWAAQEPDAVLVAGDLVDGRWGQDEHHTGNFGPVATLAQREAALRRAARTYYPQWLERFTERGLDVYPAIGDHEYGDNDWPRAKRALAPTFADAFADHFTRTRSGALRFDDHPRGRHRATAYAWRPAANVQVVSLDVFDITRGSARIRLDSPQMSWLKRVLRKANQDGVTWIVVQAHTPILGPVRKQASSGLTYEGGRRSDLWKAFKKFGVDLYLAGEVHAVTATTRDGIVQLAHGGAFQFGLTSYALLDFFDDRIEIAVKDYKLTVKDARDGSRLWETARRGMKKIAELGGETHLLGRIVLGADGEIRERTGLLRPYHP